MTVGHSPLWPELDPLEFTQAWERLSALYPGGAGERVLSLWDWQTCETVPDDEQPASLELCLTRTAAPRGTAFVFSDVPTGVRAAD